MGTQTATEFPKVTVKGIPTFAKSLWGAIPGENFAEKNTNLSALFDEIRKNRNADKDTKKRVVKSNEDVIKEHLGKSLGEMQQAMVEVAGIRLSLPQIFKIADNNDSPMQAAVKAFLKEQNITLKAEKNTSQGRAKQLLARAEAN